ncbi:helix-turn-helix domain-containing protein [Xanthomonas tesorieronis]|uniref:helix-turn-helix domain-containing protein n=1 Tax=Xanthomonas tesorieronis TaxID=3160839 RepID=UPI0035159364
MITHKFRLKRGWSQQQLADISGISLRTIQRLEAGAKPSLETLRSLAAVFEVSIEDLGEPDMTAAEHRIPSQEVMAMKQVSQLREFYHHIVVYVVVCAAVVAVLLLLSPEHWWAGLLLGLVWGADLSIHALRTFLLGGAWERRQVERWLGRPL